MANRPISRSPPKLALPPYVSYSALKQAISQMKEKGPPNRITYSTFPGFTSPVSSQLAKAFKFFGLVDETRAPSEVLGQLTAVCGTSDWGKEIEHILRMAYRPVFEAGGPYNKERLTELFTVLYDGDKGSLKKAVRLLHNALQDTSISVGPSLHVSSAVPVDAPIPMTRKRKRAVAPPGNFSGEPGRPSSERNAVGVEPAARRSAFNVLMNDIYDPSSMQPEEEAAVFLLARFLRTRE